MKNIYTKILVPNDGSKLSALALPHVIRMAHKFGSEVVLLQVVDSVLTIVPAMTSTNAIVGIEEMLEDVAKREKEMAKHNLRNLSAQLVDAGIEHITHVVESGDPREKIAQVAAKLNCDLIIMSTHGRTGFKRSLLGSVADDVVHHANCPVFLVPPKRN